MFKTFFFVLIALCFTAKINGLRLRHPVWSNRNQNQENYKLFGAPATVTFSLFLGSVDNVESHTIGRVPTFLKFRHIQPDLPVVVIVPTPFDEQVVYNFKREMLKAFRQGEYNLISVDWSFTQVSLKDGAIKAGKIAVSGFRNLFESDLNIDRIISYSTGTIVLSTAAATLRAYTMNRIVALDPTADLFRIPRKYQLKNSLARVVEVVHTSFGNQGINKKLGHRDFYPNGGASPQPGCERETDGTCSSEKAFIYYSRAATDKENPKYKAYFCSSYSDYSINKCSDNDSIYLYNDESSDSVSEGKYYLETSAE